MEEFIMFINKVSDMRDAQKDYFATRDVNVLKQAKRLEREVDLKITDFRMKVKEGKK